MDDKPIESIQEFIGKVLRIRKSWHPKDPHREIWFRGINDSSFSLLPGAYRHKDYDERSAALSFRAKVSPNPTLSPRVFPLDGVYESVQRFRSNSCIQREVAVFFCLE